MLKTYKKIMESTCCFLHFQNYVDDLFVSWRSWNYAAMLFYNFSFFINLFVIPEMLTRTINQKIPFCFNYRTQGHIICSFWARLWSDYLTGILELMGFFYSKIKPSRSYLSTRVRYISKIYCKILSVLILILQYIRRFIANI